MISTDFPTNAQATLTIWRDHILNNYAYCDNLSSGAECSAVVKANAYGMDIDQIAPALFNDTGCKTFFVANLAEAGKLRQAVPEAIIYVLGGILPSHIPYYIAHNIRPVLNDLAQIRAWADCQDSNRPTCAIHFDTGINRLGLTNAERETFFNDSALQKKLNVALVMSHLACADTPDHPMNQQQLNDFKTIRKYFPDTPASLANSGGILLGPEYHFDMVRPGLILYGGNPTNRNLPEPIKSVFQIDGTILQLRKLEAGQAVGYDATWTAEKPCHIATINIGYADGYPQLFGNCGWAYLKNTKVPIVGRVSMDMITLDVTDINPELVKVGGMVELIGGHITLEMASEVSTLSQYEILTGVGDRYQRIYR